MERKVEKRAPSSVLHWDPQHRKGPPLTLSLAAPVVLGKPFGLPL